VTVEAAPVEQRFVAGAVVTVVPLALPQTPLTCVDAWMLAVQVAVEPPLLPAQVQLQGPLPVTEVAAPVEQRLVDGAVAKVPPLLLPQTPLTVVVAETMAVS
jgi:hypothetical protein